MTLPLLGALRLFVLLAAILLPARLLAETTWLTVGVVPQQSATALAATWIPLLAEISSRSDVGLLFRTAPDIPTFEERVRKGEYDITYMNPYHYTIFSKAPGYRAFAREKDRKLVGIIVVARNSPVRDIKDLAGKPVLFPAPAAFAATPCDLMLMDCQMPVMDGFEATRLIRSDASGSFDPAIPVIAMTANAMQGDREQCLAAGMNDYLTKPIVQARLVEIIARWLPSPD